LLNYQQTIPDSITTLLAHASAGDREAFDRVFPLVYSELHRIAEGRLRAESSGHTLQPTALVHEAYLRLAGYTGMEYKNRAHFFAVAARAMRHILVDHARSLSTAKRGCGAKVALDQAADLATERSQTLAALDDALKALEVDDDRKARLVEMRFFGGMTAEEIAGCLSMSVHTVRHELRIAQAWLRRELETCGQLGCA
jgi:RNA polymerase sigma factor (TIGR02999 family)